jgi:hypothetical protein
MSSATESPFSVADFFVWKSQLFQIGEGVAEAL